jgi:hypothetical protein
VDWIGLAKDRKRWGAVVNSGLNLRVPLNAGKLSSGLTTGGLSSSAQLHRVSFLLLVTQINWKYILRAVTPKRPRKYKGLQLYLNTVT